jgi:transposase
MIYASLLNGYRAAVYNAIEPDEKWVLVSSKQADKKELITFNKRIGKTLEKAQKSRRKVCKVVYHCEKDALKAGKQWLKTLKYHTAAFSTECIEHDKKAGKPPKEAKPDWIEYKLSGQITDDIEKQTIGRRQLGRFILGTNDVDNAELTAEVMLSTYCVEQQKVERGFRFLKSDEFHLDPIDLKRPSRIDALMVYNATEYQMREAMKAQEITLPNQKGKQVARPTLRWVFQMMRGIHSLKSPGWADKVAGKTEVIKKIIRLFGAEACSIYDVEA